MQYIVKLDIQILMTSISQLHSFNLLSWHQGQLPASIIKIALVQHSKQLMSIFRRGKVCILGSQPADFLLIRSWNENICSIGKKNKLLFLSLQTDLREYVQLLRLTGYSRAWLTVWLIWPIPLFKIKILLITSEFKLPLVLDHHPVN